MPDFKKYYIIPAEPELVYRAITNANTIEAWSGDPAIMTTEPGSEFELFDGSIAGKNLEFEEGRKLVQEWYFGEDQKEPSVVTIKLHPHKQGTSAELKHTNIPPEAYLDITEGWDEAYFGNLIAFYEED